MSLSSLKTPARDAYNILDKYAADSGGDYAIPVDPFKIATTMGVRVYAAAIPGGGDGYLDVDRHGNPVLYVNQEHGAHRQRFTCAHELGHFVANDGLAGERKHRNHRSAAGTDSEEIYANRFGAALLMPKVALVRTAKTASLSELARIFKVSESAMKWRLVNLGVKPQG